MLGTARRLLSAYRKRQEEHKRQDENWRKRGEVGERIMALYGRYQDMTPTAIIDEFFQMHSYFEMPIYWTIDYFVSVTYPIFCYIARHPELTASDAERLAQILLWPETKRLADNNFNLAILDACEQFPTEKVLRILREHLPFARANLKERKEVTGVTNGMVQNMFCQNEREVSGHTDMSIWVMR
jgi:hypothetical protein